VVGRCFFPDLPDNMLTVPSCEPCNHALSLDEEYVRDRFISDYRASDHPAAQKLLHGPVRRSVVRRISTLRKDVVENSRWSPVTTKAGIYLGHAYALEIDRARFDHVIISMVKGLFYLKFRRLLRSDYRVLATLPNSLQVQDTWRAMQQVGYNGPWTYGDGVLSWVFSVDEKDPDLTIWLLTFYGGLTIEAVTISADDPSPRFP
jgi:hypothetical protein